MKYMIMTFGNVSDWDTLGLGSGEATWPEEEIAADPRIAGHTATPRPGPICSS